MNYQVRPIRTNDWYLDVVNPRFAIRSVRLQILKSATEEDRQYGGLTTSTPKISLINVDLPTPVFPQTRMRIAPGSSISTVSLSPQKASLLSTVLRRLSIWLRKERALQSGNTLLYSSSIMYTEGCRIVPCAALFDTDQHLFAFGSRRQGI